MTKKEMFNELITVVEGSAYADKEGMIDFINHEIELLNSHSSHKTPTKVQKANVGLKETIKSVLAECEEPVTVSGLLENESLSQYSSQKISALLRQLVKDGEVVRTEEKKKAYFSLAE